MKRSRCPLPVALVIDFGQGLELRDDFDVSALQRGKRLTAAEKWRVTDFLEDRLRGMIRRWRAGR